MKETQMKFKTKLGDIFICATREAVTRVSWHETDVNFLENETAAKEAILIKKTFHQINEYLEGRRQNFDLPLFFNGTDFQNEVWRALSQIPYGVTINYSELAANIKRPKAIRAVGSANGKNPLCILVPCHRVIGKSGALSGYFGGEDIKRELLNIEKPR